MRGPLVAEGDRGRRRVRAALDGHVDCLAGFVLAQGPEEVVRTGDLAPGKGRDDVPYGDPGLGGRPARAHLSKSEASWRCGSTTGTWSPGSAAPNRNPCHCRAGLSPPVITCPDAGRTPLYSQRIHRRGRRPGALRAHLVPQPPAPSTDRQRGESLGPHPGLLGELVIAQPGRGTVQGRRPTKPHFPGWPGTRNPRQCAPATRPLTSSNLTCGVKSSMVCPSPATRCCTTLTIPGTSRLR